MSKQSVITRNNKRIFLVKKYSAQRIELKKILSSPDTADNEFYKAQRKLVGLPRNSCKVRVMNRCNLTGRARSFIRRFGLSRIMFRELASFGKIPGVTKSSW